MSGPNLGERLIVPAITWLLVAVLSGAFIYGSGSVSVRMKVVFRYSMLFAGGLFYSIAWKDILAQWFGSQSAWIGVAAALGALSFWLCRLHFRDRPNDDPLP